MAQQIINIESSPGANDGDDIWVAFTKTNNNFTELYTDYLSKVAGGTIAGNILYSGTIDQPQSIVTKQYVDDVIPVLGPATATSLGGVIIGSNIIVQPDGTISVNFPVVSVAGKTGAVTLDVSDVANAASITYVNTAISGLSSTVVTSSALTALAAQVSDALNLKADKVDTYTISQVNNLLLGKADVATVSASINNINLALATKANASSVYTKSEIDAMVNACALDSDLTALAASVNDALDLKMDKSATYTIAQINALISPFATTAQLSAQNTTLTNAINLKANASSVYTKSEIDTMINACALDTDLTAFSAAMNDALFLKMDKADSYTRTQLYTRTEINNLLAPLINAIDNVSNTTRTYPASPSATKIDEFLLSNFDVTEYLVKVITPSGKQISKLMVFYDGTTVQVNEFSIMRSGSILGNFTATLTSGMIELFFTTTVFEPFTVKLNSTRI